MSDSTPRAGRFSPETAARFAAPILGALLAVFYVLSMALDFESSIGHFDGSSVLFRCVIALSAAGIALAAVCAAPVNGKTAFTALPSPGPLSVFGTVLGACMALLHLIRLIVSFRADLAVETAQSLSPVRLALAAALVGISLSAALPLSLSESRRRTWYGAVLMLLGALSVNLSMFAAYFDFSVPLNSPVRNLTTLAQAAALLFLLGEARLSLVPADEPASLPPAFQLFTSVCCAVFGIGIGGGGAIWRILSFLVPSLAANPEPNLPLARLVLYAALGCVAADRLLKTGLRRLTEEEIEEARRRAKEEKQKKKNKDKSGPEEGPSEPNQE